MSPNLLKCFSELNDNRHWNIKHQLNDIIIISVCAVICGADGWNEIEEYGKAKESFLSQFLTLANGIPSNDTFRRVFSRLDPDCFKKCFLNWVNEFIQIIGGDIIAIDGKTLRRSFDKVQNKNAIHMVSAWSHENQIVLGQVKTSEKSNEITAIPNLLKVLDIEDCVVTIDAMGAQKAIVQQIIDQGGDYVISLKGNQQTLNDDIRLYMEQMPKNEIDSHLQAELETVDGDHGRIETRRYRQITDIDWLHNKSSWIGLTSVGSVESIREINGAETREIRYYISSLNLDINYFAHAVRSHWGIENKLHWCLDIGFREDESRIRKDNAPENFAILRHLVINMIKMETSSKAGIKIKRSKAGWDDSYLMKILTGKNT